MENNKLKVAVYGVGTNYTSHSQMIWNVYDVVALWDNSPKKQGSIVDGLVVEAPDAITARELDAIIVTPGMYAGFEIRKQLESLGVSPEKIRFINSGGVTPYRIDPLFFATNLSLDEKKRLFSENVERIVLEVNSKCNRQCWFCTNSIVDRHSANIDMSDNLFEKIMGELKSIKYDGDILLSYFNEPLCCSKLYERVKRIREDLPDCFVYIFTNGDYLKREHLENLSALGLDLLWVDIYTDDKSTDYEYEKAHKRASALFNELGLDLQVDDSIQEIDICTQFNDMDLHFIARDFKGFAANRAESLPAGLPIPHITEHPLACIKNYISFHIDHNGGVWPCPNYHCDFEEHRKYQLGNLNNESIFDVFFGEKMTQYREQNLFHRDSLPCRSCIWNFYSFITNRFDRPFRDRPIYRRNKL